MSLSPTESDLFRSLGTVTFPAGGGQELVYSEASRAARTMSSSDVDLLAACRTFKTLDQHAADLCDSFGLDADQKGPVKEKLARYAEEGFLVSFRGLQESAAKADGAGAPAVSALAVPTRDRADLLERCLDSYLRNARAHGRKPRVVVADDSESPEAMDKARAALRRLKSLHGVEAVYAGKEQKEEYLRALVKEGVPREEAEFALSDPEGCGHRTGANRNLLLLETLGEAVVSVDDDTVCRPARVHERKECALACSSEGGLIEGWFFPDRGRALKAVPEEEGDFLGQHGEVLGRGLGPCLRAAGDRGKVDLDGMDARFLKLIREGRGRVGVTQNGLVGDCATGSSLWVIGQSGETQKRLVTSEEVYRTAVASRETIRSARCLTLSNRAFLMTYAVGYDNRSLLPPFMPVLRAQDGIFALTGQMCFPDILTAYLPWTVLHDPSGRPPFGKDEDFLRGEASPQYMHDILIGCLESYEMGPAKPSGKARLGALGLYLEEIGDLPAEDFREFVRKVIWIQVGNFVESLTQEMDRYGDSAPEWARDAETTVKSLLGSLAKEGFEVPMNLREGRSLEEARALSQRLVRRYGRLLRGWEGLTAAARRLKERGVSPCIPV
jgi:hypothetical protein